MASLMADLIWPSKIAYQPTQPQGVCFMLQDVGLRFLRGHAGTSTFVSVPLDLVKLKDVSICTILDISKCNLPQRS